MDSEDVVENERWSGGQAEMAGVGDAEGDGDDPRVRGEEGVGSLWVMDIGLTAMVNGICWMSKGNSYVIGS